VIEIGERYRAYINKSIHHSYEYIIDLFIHIIFLICFLSPLDPSPLASASKYYFISLGHRLPAGSSRDQRESEATIISLA
jgi:hypothetical protein